MKLSFIGYGNLAKAIARGLTQQGQYTISAAAPSLTVGVNKDHIKTHHDNCAVLNDAEVLILAVKPKLMTTVLEEIVPHLPPNCLVISVAAGLNLSWLNSHFKRGQAIIRTIPNTAAEVQLAATAMLANEFTSKTQKKTAEQIFSCIGITTWVQKENDIDTFTALSSSGLAYVFLFIEALIDSAVELGIQNTTAKIFALQTVKGALKLIDNNELSLSELRNKITTPGGTTAAALSILQGQMENLILKAMKAAESRSHELGQIYVSK